jgi:hypothetical protein
LGISEGIIFLDSSRTSEAPLTRFNKGFLRFCRAARHALMAANNIEMSGMATQGLNPQP